MWAKPVKGKRTLKKPLLEIPPPLLELMCTFALWSLLVVLTELLEDNTSEDEVVLEVTVVRVVVVSVEEVILEVAVVKVIVVVVKLLTVLLDEMLNVGEGDGLKLKIDLCVVVLLDVKLSGKVLVVLDSLIKWFFGSS